MIVNESRQQIVADNLCHQNTIDDQCDIIPHQHGRDKFIRVLEEDRKDAGRNSPLAFISKRSLSTDTKAISTPEKKAEKTMVIIREI